MLQHLVNNAKQAQMFGQIVCKFVLHILHNKKEAIVLDCENGNAHWQDAVKTETDQLIEYNVFKDLGQNAAAPKGHKLIKPQIVFDVKQSLEWIARVVARGDMTDLPHEALYSGVASLQRLCIVCLFAELNGLKLTGGDIRNTYLKACALEKVCVHAGPEFGPLEEQLLVTSEACKIPC